MIVLMDTQALLWRVEDSPRLSPSARAIISDPSNHALYSVASLWEITIKVGLGKLETKEPLDVLFSRMESRAPHLRLPLLTPHFLEYAKLPHHHRDPFDRMIIAQALSESLIVVGSDDAFDAYGVQRIW
ncbi:MAG: type II toxin-antitoxin system VapC family toxin [Chthoniobacterales bacterium]|nr:type II toxin-antitoxin system VapC family toxin [Chthoniobacterales bacterium]